MSKSVVLKGHPDTRFTYTFENFFHPFVGELIAKLNRDSLPGMLDATWQDSLSKLDPDFFHKLYNPTDSDTGPGRLLPQGDRRRRTTGRMPTTTGSCSSTFH